MIKTIVKHSYLKSHSKARPALRAHLHYIAHRPGADNKTTKRHFFTDDGPADISLVKAAVKRQPDNGVLVHKLVMSPGLQTVDIQDYVRNVLNKFAYRKGWELEWFGVMHDNTAHTHAHVLVMGRDRAGRLVRFYKEDYAYLREVGDRYLELHHPLEMAYEQQREELEKQELDFWKKAEAGLNVFREFFKKKAEPQPTPPPLPSIPIEPIRAQQQDEIASLGKNERTLKGPTSNPARIRWWRKGEPEPVIIGPGSNLKQLLELAEACQKGEYQLDQARLTMLHRWIAEGKALEAAEIAQSKLIKRIEVERGADWREEFTPRTDYKHLARLYTEHVTGMVSLKPAEERALIEWIKNRLRNLDRDDGPSRGR